jgi:hypothetical protein
MILCNVINLCYLLVRNSFLKVNKYMSNKKNINYIEAKAFSNNFSNKKESEQILPEYRRDLLDLLEEVILQNKKKKLEGMDFSAVKFLLAHMFLLVYGFELSTLKYINFAQIDNFFNRREVIIRLEKKYKGEVRVKYVIYPYVKEISWVVKKMFKYYTFLKSLQEVGDLHLFFDSKVKPDFVSEVWGHMDRSRFTTDFNKQLKIVGCLLEKKFKVKKYFTSSSYRTGIFSVASKTVGPDDARFFLGFDYNINGLENKLSQTDRRRMKFIFSSIHAVKFMSRTHFKKKLI